MLSDIVRKETGELYRTPILQQTAFWSDVKNRLGMTSLAIDFKSDRSGLFTASGEKGYVNSDLLVLIRQLGNGQSLAYVPYGPELEPDEEAQGPFLEELSESLRSYLPANCVMVRYDLVWESYWAKESDHYDEKGYWVGEPDPRFRERGCTGYDMFGISPNPDPSHPLYGLYKFKSGFGGDVYHSMGCWDYPLDEGKYNQFIYTELTSPGYHSN